MARLDPTWHEKEAERHETLGFLSDKSELDIHCYAAAFHRARLAEQHPSSVAAWEYLEGSCRKLGDWKLALSVCDRLLIHDPSLAPLYFRRAELRWQLDQWAGAAADLLQWYFAANNPIGWPDFAEAESVKGKEAAKAEKSTEAIAHFNRAALWNRAEAMHLQSLAWAQLSGRNEEAFLQTCQRLHRDYRGQRDVENLYRLSCGLASLFNDQTPFSRAVGISAAEALLQDLSRRRALIIVYTASLHPASGVPADEQVAFARRAVRLQHDWDTLETLGAALYRSGQHAEAVRTLEEAVQLYGKGGTNWMKFFLAMAHQRQGNTAKAKEWLAKAEPPGKNDDWEERLIDRLLRAEAEKLLGGP